MPHALSLIALTTYATLFAGVPAALANGDPASNVLLNASVYLPPDGTSPAEDSAKLVQTVESASKAGYDVRVAVVETARDLGNIPQFFGQAQTYAEHLAGGLRFAWQGDLLVVMPRGLGIAAQGRLEKKKAAIAKLRPAGGSLAAAGDRAVRALARAAGRPIGGRGGSVLPALLVLGALLLLGGGAVFWRMRADADAPGDESKGEQDLPPVEDRPDEG